MINQFSSVAQLCPILCNSMDWSTPGFPVHHQLPELVQTHVHRVSDVIRDIYQELQNKMPIISSYLHLKPTKTWKEFPNISRRVGKLTVTNDTF